MGVAAEMLEEADRLRLGYFERLLLSDCGRLHRAQVESNPDAMTRSRLVGSLDRALGRLGLQRMRGRAARREPPVRRAQEINRDGGDDAA